MALTTIGDQKTPGRPVQITFAPETGLPSADSTLVLLGHAASGATGINSVITINNAGDPVAGQAEAETKFGVGSELTKMVVAAINAIAKSGNLANFATLKCIPLASTDTGFGTSDAALAALNKVEAEYIVSPYDGNTSTTNTQKIRDQAALMSGAQKVQNSQFGTFAVVANQNVTDPANLFAWDTQYLVPVWFRNSAPTLSVGELAAAYAAVMAGMPIPFNPLDGQVIGGLDAPASISDYASIGANAESETALNQGWGLLKVLPNGTVAIVRTITSRITSDGVTKVGAYYDVQDFSVLYFWRKTVFTRFSQPDFSQVKASLAKAQDAKSEMIRLANVFQDQNMFQAVAQLAKQFAVERSLTDRSRFDVLTPVNVIPGLHVIATNVQAGTQFDAFTV